MRQVICNKTSSDARAVVQEYCSPKDDAARRRESIKFDMDVIAQPKPQQR